MSGSEAPLSTPGQAFVAHSVPNEAWWALRDWLATPGATHSRFARPIFASLRRTPWVLIPVPPTLDELVGPEGFEPPTKGL